LFVLLAKDVVETCTQETVFRSQGLPNIANLIAKYVPSIAYRNVYYSLIIAEFAVLTVSTANLQQVASRSTANPFDVV
jgi:hypothetical protein